MTFYRGKSYRSDNRSNAEDTVLIALMNRLEANPLLRGTRRYMGSNEPYPLDLEEDGVPFTNIDIYFRIPIEYAVFLDGDEIHTSVGENMNTTQMRRDVLVTKALEKRGIMVERFVYSAPLSNHLKNDIVESILKTLGEIALRRIIK